MGRIKKTEDISFDFIGKVIAQDMSLEQDRCGDEYMHISSLIQPDFCERRDAILYRHGGSKARKVRSDDRVVWAMGRAAENHIRKQYCSAMNNKHIVGLWKCKCGTSQYRGSFPDKECDVCNSKLDEYNEMTLSYKKWVVGNPDMIVVDTREDKLMVVEIKSMNKKEFDNLKDAKSLHLVQACCYRKLLVDKYGEGKVSEDVLVVYVRKDYQFRDTPYKEFRVDSQSRAMPTQVQQVFETADSMLNFRKSKSSLLPPRSNYCNNLEDTKAKNCLQCSLCFNL